MEIETIRYELDQIAARIENINKTLSKISRKDIVQNYGKSVYDYAVKHGAIHPYQLGGKTSSIWINMKEWMDYLEIQKIKYKQQNP